MAGDACARSMKPAEESPDGLGAVDIAVLRPEQAGRNPREAGIRRKAGHAVSTTVDTIQHDVVPVWAARGDPRDRGSIVGRLVRHIGRVGIAGLAAIELAPESQRLLRRPESVRGKIARS